MSSTEPTSTGAKKFFANVIKIDGSVCVTKFVLAE
jgi:hypothetical protein